MDGGIENLAIKDLALTPLQVVSDIDDTLMCSGGHFPAGSDLRYPRNCVYPGVLAFYRGLDTAFASRVQVQSLKLSAFSAFAKICSC